MEGMTKFQCIGTSTNCTQNPLKLFHDVRLQENPRECVTSQLWVLPRE